MTPERWQQIREVYEAASALDPGQRSPYLDRIAGGDSELRREVESLLCQEERVESGFLNLPAPALLNLGLEPGGSGSRAGRTAGAYQLTQEIGHGGMGEVYRAHRVDGQYEKEVAIKLVRGGYDTGLILERFRHERQILASLDHPNIARLLDGGTTEDGIPFLVMELIAGTPVDRYCEERKLSVSDRLILFRQVCAAVQYAHQHLIVHRDLKPSNILVTDEGVPKLLDFGIAKILGASAGEEATLPHAMTPEYASPEQIRGEPITTATDVYSLGVVLYRLLAGCSPYPAETRSQHELARAICETEPERPSTAAWRVSRQASAAKLRRRLQGDLDTIVLKALRKEPQRRYVSVEQFSEDIRRHLAGLPVTAAPDSWAYRGRKFMLRNKAAVAAAALVVVTLSGGILGTLRQARIARRQAEIARIQGARAEKRFNDVRQFSDSLIFDIHDAIQNLPGATPARKLLLDRAVEYLDQASQDAAGNFDLQRELGWGYQRLAVVQGSPTESNLGDTAAAEASNRKAAALFEAVAAGNPHDVIDQLNVAMIHRILAFSTLLRPSGKRDLEMAMAITDRLMLASSDDPRVRSERSIEYQNLALMEDAFGYRARALEDFRKDMVLKQSILQTTPGYRRIRESIAVTSVLVADELVLLGSRQEARQQIQDAVEMFREVLAQGDDINVRRELAVSRTKLGEIELMEGNTVAASAIFQDVRSGLLPMAQNDPQNQMLQLDVAGLDYEQARVLASAGNYAAAMPALRRAVRTFQDLRTKERAIDDVGPGLGAFYIWLGEAQAGAGDLRAALDSYRKAAGVLESSPGEAADDDSRCQLATSYLKAGKALLRQGDTESAGTAYRKALDIAAPLAAPEKQDIPALYILAEAYGGVADVYREQAPIANTSRERTRLAAEARAWYQKSLAAWGNIPHPSSISPEGFVVEGPVTIASRLAEF